MAEKVYIELKPVEEKLRSLVEYYRKSGLFGLMDVANQCFLIIEAAPHADVEPVIHSKWVDAIDDLEDGNGFRTYPHCKNCGRAVYRHDAGERCCRCGARMRGGKDA